MKRKLTILFAIIGVTAFSSSGFAIDNIIHDIADHTIGLGHHREYYSYGNEYDYHNRSHYRRTRVRWDGGHRHHYSRSRTIFSIGTGHGNDHGHDGH